MYRALLLTQICWRLGRELKPASASDAFLEPCLSLARQLVLTRESRTGDIFSSCRAMASRGKAMMSVHAPMSQILSQIVYLKTACERCSGHIEYPSQLAEQSIDCPHCYETITLPSPPRSVPTQSTSSPPPVSNSVRSTPPARRHGIFYYVFWGSIFLFATLGILTVGFLFLTGAGAAFLVAISHHPGAVQSTSTKANIQKLPALNATEIEQAKSLITGLSSRLDGIEGTIWYSPDPADNHKTAVYLYIGQKQARQPWLRWKIRYYGDDWLFIRRYRVKVDDAEPVTVLPMKEIKRENGGGEVWETFDEAASEHAHVLNQMLSGNTTYLCMEGSEGRKDLTLGPEQLQRMGDVLLVFRYLGGTWPAN
jgi:hypothetical protein